MEKSRLENDGSNSSVGKMTGPGEKLSGSVLRHFPVLQFQRPRSSDVVGHQLLVFIQLS